MNDFGFDRVPQFHVCFVLLRCIFTPCDLKQTKFRHKSGMQTTTKRLIMVADYWENTVEPHYLELALISNYRLSRSENLVPVLTLNYDNR